MSTNKYPGDCDHCKASVSANAGIYTWGTIYCSEAHMNDAEQAFETKKAAEALELNLVKRNTIIPNCIAKYELTAKQVANLVAKATKKRTDNVDDLTDDELGLFLGAMHKYADRSKRAAEVRVLKKDGKCVRCSGAGGADKWRDTGWTCYSCGGTGRHMT